jgi:NADH dehydrogenase FAD-containing subunit
LDYEYLIIAVGAATKTFGVAGVPEFAIPLKDAADAWTIRQKVLDRFHTAALPSLSDDERRKLLSFVVVGGGPTGVEFAAELHDLIADDLRATRPDLAELASVTLLEAGPDILSSFHERLRSYTRRHYDRQGITVRLHSPVKEVLSDAVVLASGERIDAGLTVWSAGVTSVEFVNRLPVRKDAAGRVLTDRCLRMVDHPRIFAAGDCAAVESVVYPMTGQLAQQQGKYLGKALHRIAKGRAPRPFRYFHQGMLTYVGGQRALAETPGGRLRGWIAWLMWRAIYLTKLVSLRNKVQVLTDWIRSHVFGRELSSY